MTAVSQQLRRQVHQFLSNNNDNDNNLERLIDKLDDIYGNTLNNIFILQQIINSWDDTFSDLCQGEITILYTTFDSVSGVI